MLKMDLQRAIKNHDAKLLQNLINRNISLNEKLPCGKFPFEYAVYRGAIPLISIFAVNNATKEVTYRDLPSGIEDDDGCILIMEELYDKLPTLAMLALCPLFCGCNIYQSDTLCPHGFNSMFKLSLNTYMELVKYNCHDHDILMYEKSFARCISVCRFILVYKRREKTRA